MYTCTSAHAEFRFFFQMKINLSHSQGNCGENFWSFTFSHSRLERHHNYFECINVFHVVSKFHFSTNSHFVWMFYQPRMSFVTILSILLRIWTRIGEIIVDTQLFRLHNILLGAYILYVTYTAVVYTHVYHLHYTYKLFMTCLYTAAVNGMPVVYPYYTHIIYRSIYTYIILINRPSTVIGDNGFFNKTTLVHYMKLRVIITSGVIKI